MSVLDSPVDRSALHRARALLRPPPPRDNGLVAVAAAAFFAFSGLALAVVTITTPAAIQARAASAGR